jgi:hypothetical protein
MEFLLVSGVETVSKSGAKMEYMVFKPEQGNDTTKIKKRCT